MPLFNKWNTEFHSMVKHEKDIRVYENECCLHYRGAYSGKPDCLASSKTLTFHGKPTKAFIGLEKNKWPEFPEGKEVAQNISSTFKRKSNMPTFCVDTLIDSNDCNQSMWLFLVSPSSKKGQLSSSLHLAEVITATEIVTGDCQKSI